MFERILIANRGEIACRVIRTAHAMGVRTVAVHSEADADALHVAMADEAIAIGSSAPTESYLRIERIVDAAREANAEAIHPGYGFLSENPEFAEAVEAAGLVFIGPSAEAIRKMGSKGEAKALMEKAGLPVVPGYHGSNQEPGRLEAEAAALGYPVLIKAVAGGGGKGMRRVDAVEEFIPALESAKSEALGSFGNDSVLIEKFVEKPRHIEMQIFGDGAAAVHLFERDCSLQRRHQKVIEEAPAPGMTMEMRAAMADAAVRAAEAIGYRGAGTVEFIVDATHGLKSDGFFFMEMNTRLQVEHPVTEAVTGIDLVEWQLRVAAGEPLPLSQDGIALSGHAIEARLYAEDVPKGFLPATGRLTHLHFPDNARAETGVRPGDAITAFYDPMIAKVIVHGATRNEALDRMRAALAATEVAGSVTNHAFLRKLAAHQEFIAGDVDTGLIDRNLNELAAAPVPCSRTKALAALAALGLSGSSNALQGFSLWEPLRHRVRLLHGNEAFAAEVLVSNGGVLEVHVEESVHLVERRGAGWWCIDGAKTEANLRHDDAGIHVFRGNGYSFNLPNMFLEEAATGDGNGDLVEAPMPGLIKSIHVLAGDDVAKGDPLAVLEAMKMEHAMAAARDGRVAEVLVTAGTQVEAGAALIRLEAAES